MLENKPEEKKIPEHIKIEIPADVVEKMDELKKKKDGLVRLFMQLAFQTEVIAEKKSDTFSKMKTIDENLNGKLKYAYDKLKLKKRTECQWQYDGQKHFIGIPLPPKKDPVKK